ncbi:MAG: hypothetical protein PHV78_03335 [Patescibacteria group bacterium]|nr:hypothetical protein [Patescibacteria group bacterium]MDD5121580.1 hypothetical protein [Patescibacteria group bacterium]MDD5222121.1 hypothetical protein [Patescibacteria group bacterium]MDD5396256.1 hypothetical protein [Patescibacteria group bacterium]
MDEALIGLIIPKSPWAMAKEANTLGALITILRTYYFFMVGVRDWRQVANNINETSVQIVEETSSCVRAEVDFTVMTDAGLFIGAMAVHVKALNATLADSRMTQLSTWLQRAIGNSTFVQVILRTR